MALPFLLRTAVIKILLPLHRQPCCSPRNRAQDVLQFCSIDILPQLRPHPGPFVLPFLYRITLVMIVPPLALPYRHVGTPA